jgi:hypothetical protein
VITHIAGEYNFWADLLFRWAVQPRLAVRKLMLAPVAGFLAIDNEEWPTWKAVKASQQAGREKFPAEVVKDNDGVLCFADGTIPAADERLQLRLLIVAHCSAAGHRGILLTQSA